MIDAFRVGQGCVLASPAFERAARPTSRWCITGAGDGVAPDKRVSWSVHVSTLGHVSGWASTHAAQSRRAVRNARE
jgi:hypothetical protein